MTGTEAIVVISCLIVVVCLLGDIVVRIWAPTLIDSWRISAMTSANEAAESMAKIAAIVRDPDGELLDKLEAIGELVGVPPPPAHISPIQMGDELIEEEPAGAALGFIDRADVPVGGMRRSIHRSHRGEGNNFVD